MDKRDINSVKEIIEQVFSEEGNYVDIERDTGESWEDALHRTLPDLPEDCIEVLKGPGLCHRPGTRMQLPPAGALSA